MVSGRSECVLVNLKMVETPLCSIQALINILGTHDVQKIDILRCCLLKNLVRYYY